MCLCSRFLRALWRWYAGVGTAVATANEDRSGAYLGFSHMVLIVTIEGQRFLVDTGFGIDNIIQPLPLVAGPVLPGVRPMSYRLLHKPIRSLQKRDFKYWVLQLQKEDGDDFMDCYAFNPDMEFMESDFKIMSLVVNQTPGTIFTNGVLCVRAILVDGEVMGIFCIMGDELKERRRKVTAVLKKFTCEDDRIDALKEHFGVEITKEQKTRVESGIAAIKKA